MTFVQAAVRELKRVLLQTDLHEKLTEKIRDRLKTFRLRANDDRKKLEKDLTRLDGEVGRLVAFIRTTNPATSPGAFETVRTSLEKATAEQRESKAKLDALKTPAVEPHHPDRGGDPRLRGQCRGPHQGRPNLGPGGALTPPFDAGTWSCTPSRTRPPAWAR